MELAEMMDQKLKMNQPIHRRMEAQRRASRDIRGRSPQHLKEPQLMRGLLLQVNYWWIWFFTLVSNDLFHMIFPLILKFTSIFKILLQLALYCIQMHGLKSRSNTLTGHLHVYKSLNHHSCLLLQKVRINNLFDLALKPYSLSLMSEKQNSMKYTPI